MVKSEILAAIKALEVSFTTYHQNFRKFLNDFDSRLANLTNTSPPSTLPLPLQPTINDVPEKLQISTPIAAPRLVAPTEPPLLFPNHHHLSFSHQNPSPPDLITNPQISPRNSHWLSLKSVNLSLTALRRVAVAAQPSRPNPFISSTHNHHRFHCLLHSLPRLPAPPPLPPPPRCCLNSCTKPILLVLYGRAITWVEEPPGFELFSVAVENRHFLGNSSEKGSSYLSEACVFTSASSYTFNTKNHETHLDSLQDLKSEYNTYEDLALGTVKEGFLLAYSHPLITTGAVVGNRQFLSYKAMRLFLSEETLLTRANAKVKELRKSVELLKGESEKLEKRALQAEEDLIRGRTKLRQAGKQIQGVISSAYKIERQARGLKDALSELPSREAAQFRTEVCCPFPRSSSISNRSY